MEIITCYQIKKWIRKEIWVACKLQQKYRMKSYFYWPGYLYTICYKYINGRIYSCLDYVCKHSRKVYVYKTHPRVLAFMTRDIIALNSIFIIFSIAELIKLMICLKICQWILKLLLHTTEILFLLFNS